MASRTIVVGDIHGKLKLFDRLLETMNYQAGEDKLILIGDLVDRGEYKPGPKKPKPTTHDKLRLPGGPGGHVTGSAQ